MKRKVSEEMLRNACLLIFVSMSLFLGICGCSYVNRRANLSDDNILEEGVEEVLRARFGLTVDLTPNTEEHHGTERRSEPNHKQ